MGILEKIDEHSENGCAFYYLDQIMDKFEVIELENNCYLALDIEYWEGAPGKVDFCLFDFRSSSADREPRQTTVSKIWWGYGFSSGLRELRHSYFGDDGYVFYAPLDAMRQTIDILKKYFD